MCRHWIVQFSRRMRLTTFGKQMCSFNGKQGVGWQTEPQAQIDPRWAPMGVRLSSAVHMNSYLTVDRLMNKWAGGCWGSWPSCILALVLFQDLPSPLLRVNVCMWITVCRESSELIELVGESHPVCSICNYPMQG